MLKNNLFLLFFLIIFLGVFVRLFYFGSAPPSPDWDEASIGYNAYSLLKTGKDEWGIQLPTLFRAFGDFKLPVYVYMAVVPQAVLGVNLITTRLPSLVAGVGIIIFAFAIGRKAKGNFVGLLTALLVALSPWTFFLSRIGLEANVCAFLIISGLYYLITGKLSRAVLLLGLSVWTYNSARVFVPLFLFSYLIFFKQIKKLSPINYLLLTILFVPMFWQLLNINGQARYQNLSLIDSGAISRINIWQNEEWGGRALYNKATYFTISFFKNYISYLSPNFLFLNGGSHYQHSVPGQGLLYLINLPFFYFGIFILIKNFKFKINKFLLFWLLLSPIAGSVTRDSPHTTRAIVMLPLPMLISTLGLDFFVNKFKFKKLILGLFFGGLAIGMTGYFPAFLVYHQNYSWVWQYGYQQSVQYVKDHYNEYDQIIFTKKYGEPHVFVSYFWLWDPIDFQTNKAWDYHANWYWVNQMGKINFVNDWEMKSYKYLPNTLIIASPDNDPAGKELERINFLDGKTAFIIRKI